MGDRLMFSKNLRVSLFNDDLLNEPRISLVSTFKKFLSKWPLKKLGPILPRAIWERVKYKRFRMLFCRLILLLEERDGGNLHILEAMRHLRREPTQNFKEAEPIIQRRRRSKYCTVCTFHLRPILYKVLYRTFVHTVSLLTICNYEIRHAIFY
jgi:hypothetical protein